MRSSFFLLVARDERAGDLATPRIFITQRSDRAAF